jgi:hypothetical protein
MRFTPVVLLAVVAALVAVPSASALDLDDARLPDAIVGVPYKFQLKGEKGCEQSHHYNLHSGYLPPGLTLTREGLISGTPTVAAEFQFFVQLTDDCNSAPSEGKMDLRVYPPLVVATEGLQPSPVGRPYAATLVMSEKNLFYWGVTGGALPPGLTLNPGLTEQGILSGTPTAAGSFTFTVTVQDPQRLRTATKQFTLVIASPVSASAPAAQPAEVGVRFSAKPTATGGAAPFGWSVTRGSLPAGLTLNPSTGEISGIPTAAGSFPVTLGVAEAAGSSATVDLTLTIAPRLAVATARLARATARRPYRARLAFRGGVAPVIWVARTLPRGLRLTARTGMLAGTPRKAGTYRVTVTATDALGVRAARTLVLTVRV